jgi:hypothetical protein
MSSDKLLRGITNHASEQIFEVKNKREPREVKRMHVIDAKASPVRRCYESARQCFDNAIICEKIAIMHSIPKDIEDKLKNSGKVSTRAS